MKNWRFAARWRGMLTPVLRLLLLLYIAVVLLNMNEYFSQGNKSSFVTLIVIGVATGLSSNWRFIAGIQFSDPINIIGSFFGIAAVSLIVFRLKDIGLPFSLGYSTAFQALAALLLAKVGLKILQVSLKKGRPRKNLFADSTEMR